MSEVIGSKQLSVLQAISRLGENAYGVSISDHLSRAGQSTALPQVYLALDKLVQKGFVDAKMGEPTAERGGRRKRLYSITGKGFRVLMSAESQSSRTQTLGVWIPSGDLAF